MTPTILAVAGLGSGPSPLQTDLAVIILAALVLMRRRTR